MTPVLTRSRELLIGGIATHYLTAGEGFPLVLLHGTAIDSGRLSFGPSIEAFARSYRVIAPDWPGYGHSERPGDPLTIPDYVRFLHSFLAALRIERCHLVGFSMGGAVALGFALEHSECVDKLALISSYGLDDRVQVPLLPYLALNTPLLKRRVWKSLRYSKVLTRLFLRRFVFADPKSATDELVSEVYAQLEVPESGQSFMDWLHGELRPYRFATSYARRLGEVRVPTLLMHGARDLVVPASRARRAAGSIRGARLELLPGCGHWLPREAGATFRREVLAFLAPGPEQRDRQAPTPGP